MQRLEPLIDVQQLADYLDVPVKTLYAWRYRREGPPAFRVGRHLRYRRCDIQRWIEQQIDTGASAFRVTDST
jgi:excisionase family DNA binding protein